MSDKKENKEMNQEQPGKENDREDLDSILGKLTESEHPSAPQETPPKPTPAPAAEPVKEEAEGLDNILDKISENSEEPAEELSVFQRIVGIFMGPTRVFEYLRLKPEYWIPIILTALISIGASLMVYDIALNDQINRIEQNENIPDEQKDLIVDNIEQSRTGGRRIIYTYVVPAVSTLVLFALVSAIFLFVGNILLGGKARFAQVFSAYSYSYLILAIAGTVIKLPLWLTKQTLKVDTSLAVFLPGSLENTAVYRFIASFDIFTVWFLIVFGIGFAIIYRFSQLKGILSVMISWLLYVVLFKVVLGGIFSAFTG